MQDTGKSVLVRKLLSELNEYGYIYLAIDFNYCTASAALQAFLENAFEMKTDKLYAPPGHKLQPQNFIQTIFAI